MSLKQFTSIGQNGYRSIVIGVHVNTEPFLFLHENIFRLHGTSNF